MTSLARKIWNRVSGIEARGLWVTLNEVEFEREKLKSEIENLRQFHSLPIEASQIDKRNWVRNFYEANPTPALEIGPFNRPLIVGREVEYFEILTKDELVSRAQDQNLEFETIPNIDYVDKYGNLNIIQKKFPLVLSSHVIEHQPNLIRHLNEIQNILNLGGKYILIIPDKRYCFDHFLPESSVIDIVKANDLNKLEPDQYDIIEHRALTGHNDAARHWSQDHGNYPSSELKKLWQNAKNEYSARSTYIDVHCWKFTPDSFALIIDILNKIGLIQFRVETLLQTSLNDLEFLAVLELT